jgi:hypothetical protein
MKTYFAWIGEGITFVSLAISTNEVAQLILLILGIIGALFTIVIDIINVCQKIKAAKADGKITDEEKKDIAESIKQVGDDIGNLKDAVQNGTKKKDN